MDRENYIKQILELKTDEEKMKMLKTLTLDEQIIVIKSFSDENIKKYIGKFKYQYYFESLLDGIKDEMYKIEQFKKTKDLYTKLSIISETSNRDFQYKLISMLDGSIYKDLLKTNFDKQNYIKDINLNVKYDIDPDITFGVELEAYNPDLLKRPQIIVANKMDQDEATLFLQEFKEKLQDDIPIFEISALTKTNLQALN